MSVLRISSSAKMRQESDPLPPELRRQVNKRLTLNLLIQGASAHASLTAHHLVKDELKAFRRRLVRTSDLLSVSLLLNYSVGDFMIIYGRPTKFWSRTHRPNHPCHRFPLLAKYGAELSRSEIAYNKSLGWKRGVWAIPVLHAGRLIWHLARAWISEMFIRRQLAELATLAASRLWGIDKSRLSSEIRFRNIEFGNVHSSSPLDNLYRSGAFSYGGVVLKNDAFIVQAKGWTFWLVMSELIKGTAELICLHGLNSLDEPTYQRVVAEADRLENEPWSIQTGPELWRRFLKVLPQDRTTAEMLMHVARLDPEPLEDLMMAVVTDPDHARILLNNLGQ